MHSLHPDPDRLRAGRVTALSVDAAAQLGHRLSGDALPRSVDVWLKNGLERGMLVVEQTIGAGHLSVSTAGCRNAGRRMPSQLREYLSQAIVQTFVLFRSAVFISSNTQETTIGVHP